jgi:hypothetical protein
MDMVDQFVISSTLEERQTEFRRWVECVRDPAAANTEGLRQISVLNCAAVANYEIAQLLDQRWAVTVHCSYNCGNHHGVGMPWSGFSTRDDCVEFFLKSARHHFRLKQLGDFSERQHQAQREMKRLLNSGLFGFIEPPPVSTRLEPAPAGRFRLV